MRKIICLLFISTLCINVFASANGYCAKYGAELVEKANGAGKKYKLCIFEDNRQCTVRALKEGACPLHGVKITGFDNDAQIYCAVNGGKVLAQPNAICHLPNGKNINVDKYYNK